jgi:hypothetical protein
MVRGWIIGDDSGGRRLGRLTDEVVQLWLGWSLARSPLPPYQPSQPTEANQARTDDDQSPHPTNIVHRLSTIA